MKERPILFSGPMVRAILDGRKTQTRRIVKPQPSLVDDVWRWPPDGPTLLAYSRPEGDELQGDMIKHCPYGAPGDRIWVRETWATSQYFNESPPRATNNHGLPFWYSADDSAKYTGATTGGRGFMTRGKWRPSIHMPRWASRITLEITAVRVERLQAISEADAIAEGVEQYKSGYFKAYNCKEGFCTTAFVSFMSLWSQINSPGSWDANPWVWVVEFRRVGP